MKTARHSLWLAISLSAAAQSSTVTFNADNPAYLDLDSGIVRTSLTGAAEVLFHRDQIQTLRDAAYTGTDSYSSVTSISPYSLDSTFGPAGGELINGNQRDNDELITWNENWWGANSNGLMGRNLDDGFNFLGQQTRYGMDALQVDDGAGNLTHGLIFPRKDATVDKRDLVALPFNQLIVRTSEGDKYVRLRATSIGDPLVNTGERLANWASNNIYFKYAVAGTDGAFGPEMNMCISFSNDTKEPYIGTNEANKVDKNAFYPTPDNPNPTFGYSFYSVDVWYKQQFIDFDTIVSGPGSSVGSTVDSSGNIDISAYNTALADDYAEGCIEAFYDGRPPSAFPSQYVNGLYYIGADTPLSSRRADWLDDDDNIVTPFDGNEEWDIAFGLSVAPSTLLDVITATYTLDTATLINSGRIGESGASSRSSSGYAAAVMIPGSNINVSASQNIGDATGNYTLVADIDDVRSELGGQTVREALIANGKSVTEQYNSIDTDNNGTIISNERVYVLDRGNRQFKFQVQSYDAITNSYTVQYDQL